MLDKWGIDIANLLKNVIGVYISTKQILKTIMLKSKLEIFFYNLLL